MSTQFGPTRTPLASRWCWWVSAASGAVGLGLVLGFEEPPVSAEHLRLVLAVSLGAFALSRVLMFLPPAGSASRLKRWWPDYLLLVAAGVWWGLDHTREPILLQLGAGYSLLTAGGAAVAGGLRFLVHGGVLGRPSGAGRRLLGSAIAVSILGGAVLSLPVCWGNKAAHPAVWDSAYPAYKLAVHTLDCTFTAVAALTGTALTRHDIATEFARPGQVVILLLMQIGGLAALVVGTCAGWRLRRLVGWGGIDDDTSPGGIRRLVVFTIAAAVVLEAVGAVLLMSLGAVGESDASAWSVDRLFAGLFYAVSAFCNAGLTLTADSLIPHRHAHAVYAAILPLMILGSLGGPVLYELTRRAVRHRGLGMDCLSRHTAYTLLAAGGLMAAGTLAVRFIENSTAYQLRFPREDTPGRLMLPATAPVTTTSHSPETTQRAEGERLATLPAVQQWSASAFLAVSAGSGGLWTVRIDEASLSPATRTVLTLGMLVGGGVGGTAGGLRIAVVLLLLGALVSPGRSLRVAEALPRQMGRQQGIILAAAIGVTQCGLAALCGVVLIYRETGSPLACLFEAVSATCNVGLSTGLTQQLSVQGRVAVMVAMLLGRVLPLALLMRCLWLPLPPSPQAGRVGLRIREPMGAPAAPLRSVGTADSREAVDAPIPLEGPSDSH